MQTVLVRRNLPGRRDPRSLWTSSVATLKAGSRTVDACTMAGDVGGEHTSNGPRFASPEMTSVRPASSDEWDRIWASARCATYFHSREWAEVWERTSGSKLRPGPLLVQFAGGDTALLPLVVRVTCVGLVKSYQSSVAGTYGGWLAEKSLSDANARALAGFMVRRFGRLDWRLNPLDDQALKSGFPVHALDTTQMVDLREGMVAVERRWSKGHRAAAKQARRAGVAIRRASSRSDWQAYDSIYRDSLTRWGDRATTEHPARLFEEFGKLESDRVQLWLAEFEGRTVAGALCLHGVEHISYWHGAAMADSFHLRPVHLLMFEVMRDACERGYTWFDFNPTGALEGVRAFKKSFGADAKDTPVVRLRPRWRRGIDALFGRRSRTDSKDPAETITHPIQGGGMEKRPWHTYS